MKLTKEKAVEMAIAAGFAEMTSDRLHIIIHRLCIAVHNAAIEEAIKACNEAKKDWELVGAEVSNYKVWATEYLTEYALQPLKEPTP